VVMVSIDFIRDCSVKIHLLCVRRFERIEPYHELSQIRSGYLVHSTG